MKNLKRADPMEEEVLRYHTPLQNHENDSGKRDLRFKGRDDGRVSEMCLWTNCRLCKAD